MATLTRYWRTDSTAGGDGTADATTGATRAYPSLNALIVAADADWITNGNSLHAICTQAGVDTASVIVDNTNITNATNLITIECQGAARNDGVSRELSGSGYQIRTVSIPIQIRTGFVRLIGIECTCTADSQRSFLINFSSTSDIRIDDTIIGTLSTLSSSIYAFELSGSSTLTINNSFIYSGNHRAADFRNGTTTMDHCGLVGGGTLGLVADAGVTVTNTWANGYTSQCFWTGGSAPAGSNNASSDASVSTDYTASVASFTDTAEFTNPTNALSTADYTLLDSLLNAVGIGSLATDITGAARSGTADIGPFDFAAGGATVVLGQLTETNLAQSFGKSKLKAVGLNTETDLAQTFGRAKASAVGLVTEADTGNPITFSKLKTIGLQSETDTAQAFGKLAAKSIGLATETDVGQTLARSKAKPIGLVIETDQVLSFTVLGAIQVSLGLITEADTAQPLVSAKRKAIGLLSETDIAQSFGIGAATAIGLVTETDSLFAVGSAKAKQIGLVTETDTLQTMSAQRAYDLGLVTEADFAFAASVAKAANLGLVSETDTVFAITGSGPAVAKAMAVQIVVEARNVHIVVEKRDNIIMAKVRNRRFDVKKLH